MAIKASAQITISKVIDIYACYRYYKLQSSTLAKPSKPTTNPPSGWSDTEPAYVSGSTNTLYFVDCNVYSDKSFSFSEVSKSSSYEAAKDAWNKANNAQNTVDKLEIGGRNLVLNGRGNSKTGFFANFSKVTDEYGEVTISSKKNYSGIYLTAGYLLGCRDYEVDKVYVFSYDIMFTVWDFPTGTNRSEWWIGQRYTNTPSGETGTGQWLGVTLTRMPEVGSDGCELNKWFHVEKKIMIPKQASPNVSTEAKISLYNSYADATAKVTFRMKNVKLEKGNKATDWTPAPEDSIAKVDVEYYLSTSATALSGGSWSTTAPTWVNGKYMWSRTVTVDGAGNKTYSPNQNGVCIAGAKGDTGAKGDKGDKGATGETGPQGPQGGTGATGKGVSSIVEQYYKSTSSTALSGGSWSNTYPGWENGKYIWTRSVITYTDKNSTTTTPVCVTGTKGNTGAKGEKGDTGPQGPQGVQGVKGADGKTYYTWIKYADSPTSGMSDNPSGKKYIGVAYNKTTTTESTTYSDYSWSLIKGDKGDKGDKGETGGTGPTGNGIKSITYYYARTTSQTAPSAANITATSMPTLDATNKYLWQKEVITYTNNTSQTSVLLLAVYGNTGAKGDKGDTGATGPAGKGISSTAVTYQASTSGTSIPTGTWATSIPSVAAGSYLWTRTIITYTDKTSTTSYAVGKMGNTGATGKGIKSTSITYQAHSNGITAPTGTWTDLVPTTSAEKPYLWSRTILTYTDNTTSTTYSVGSTPDGVLDEIKKVLRYDDTKIVLGRSSGDITLELVNNGLSIMNTDDNLLTIIGEVRETLSEYTGNKYNRTYAKISGDNDISICSGSDDSTSGEYGISEIKEYTGVDPGLTGHESHIDIITKAGNNGTAANAIIKLVSILNGRAAIKSRILEEAEQIILSGKSIQFKPTEGLTYDIPKGAIDCDILTSSSGIYYLTTGSKNRPTNTDGWLECKVYGTTYIHQMYTANTGEIYVRIKKSGSWTAWDTVYEDTGWITQSSIDATGDFFKYRKRNGIVDLVMNASGYSGFVIPAKTSRTWSILPAGYRPSITIEGVATNKAFDGNQFQYLIDANGNVQVWNLAPSGSSGYWAFETTFIAG